MGSVGLFAGRGDVILSMAIALVFGFWLGYKAKSIAISIKSKFFTKE